MIEIKIKRLFLKSEWTISRLSSTYKDRVFVRIEKIESSLAITAAAHLSPLVDWADLDGNLLIRNDPFTGLKVEKGKLILNDNPGLGVTGTF